MFLRVCLDELAIFCFCRSHVVITKPTINRTYFPVGAVLDSV